jgi:hypothetical protein
MFAPPSSCGIGARSVLRNYLGLREPKLAIIVELSVAAVDTTRRERLRLPLRLLEKLRNGLLRQLRTLIPCLHRTQLLPLSLLLLLLTHQLEGFGGLDDGLGPKTLQDGFISQLPGGNRGRTAQRKLL